MKVKLIKIAELINGRIEGNADIEISGVAGIEEARDGDITFLSHKKYLKNITGSKASAFILPLDIKIDRPLIRVANPYLAFAKLLELFSPASLTDEYKKIDGKAHIGKDVTIGDGVSLYPYAYIGDNAVIGDNVTVFPGVFIGNRCRIGKHTTIHANVSIYGGVAIGSNVIIHSGAVIGSDGFGYTKDENNKYYKIPQVGSVIIEDNVEIGANVCIDRATMGVTIIKKGTKIDNLVQIAHNVSVGEDSVLAGQTGISGSCRLGRNVTLAGQVGLADHVNIADNTILVANSGVAKSIEKSGVYSGSPAIEHNIWKRAQVSLPKLPDLIKKIKRMEKRIEELEKGGGGKNC